MYVSLLDSDLIKKYIDSLIEKKESIYSFV